MTTVEPPSGAEDLTAQAEAAEIATEREELDKDRRIAELQRQLDAANRAAPAAPEVIEPDGSVSTATLDKALYILDEETDEPVEVGGQLLLKSEYPTDGEGLVGIGEDGQALRFADVELDDEGEPLLDDEGKLIPRWTGGTLEYKGRTLQVNIPTPGAIAGFQQLLAPSMPSGTVNRLHDKFMSKHISPLTRRQITEWLIDGEWTAEDWGGVFRLLVTKGTARPTKRSRS